MITRFYECATGAATIQLEASATSVIECESLQEPSVLFGEALALGLGLGLVTGKSSKVTL